MTTNRIKLGFQFAAAGLFALNLMGCAADDSDNTIQASALPSEQGRSTVTDQAGQKALQCVPYARAHSDVKIFGDAYTWWDQAAGKYERGPTPAVGAVMVLHDYAGTTNGHVAVVKRIVSPREIRVDHANWLDDGSIYINDPVVDISAENDWSAVKVWNIKTGGWGSKVYPVQGFIGSGSDNSAPRAANSVAGGRAVPGEAAQDTSDGAPAAEDSVADARIAPRSRSLAAHAQPVAAMPSDLDTPADASHALTAEDLAIP